MTGALAHRLIQELHGAPLNVFGLAYLCGVEVAPTLLTVEYVAADLGLRLETVSDALRECCERGWLARARTRGGFLYRAAYALTGEDPEDPEDLPGVLPETGKTLEAESVNELISEAEKRGEVFYRKPVKREDESVNDLSVEAEFLGGGEGARARTRGIPESFESLNPKDSLNPGILDSTNTHGPEQNPTPLPLRATSHEPRSTIHEPRATKSGHVAPAVEALAYESATCIGDLRGLGFHCSVWIHANKHGLEEIVYDALREIGQRIAIAKADGKPIAAGRAFNALIRERFEEAGKPMPVRISSNDQADLEAFRAHVAAQKAEQEPARGSPAAAARLPAPPEGAAPPASKPAPAQTDLYDPQPAQVARERQTTEELRSILSHLSPEDRTALESTAFAAIRAGNRFLYERIQRAEFRWDDNKCLRENVWPYIARELRKVSDT